VSAPSPPVGTRAAVRAAVLSQDAIGTGWTVDARAPPVACPAIDPWRDATVKAISPLLRQESVAVQQTVAALPTPALARASSKRLQSRPAQACFERALKAEIRRRQGIANFGPMTAVRGDANEQRSTISSLMEYGKVTTCIDEIRTQAGRVLADTVVISGPEPVSEELLERIVARVRQRLRDATEGVAPDSGSDVRSP
jgi:hypothetical protein